MDATMQHERTTHIVETHYNNGENIRGTLHKLREHFSIYNRPSRTAVVNLIQKFERTGSVSDVKIPMRLRSGRICQLGVGEQTN